MAKKSSKKSSAHGRVTPKGTTQQQQQSPSSVSFSRRTFERTLPSKGHGFSTPPAPARTGHRGQR